MENLYVGITDIDWFNFLQSNQNKLGDYINFWTPSTTVFKALAPGELFLFKLHNKKNTIENGEIVGGGIFRNYQVMNIDQAWNKFGIGNGYSSISQIKTKINNYKRKSDVNKNLIGYIVIEKPFFLNRNEWIQPPIDWSDRIVKGKTYSQSSSVGKELFMSVITYNSYFKDKNIIENVENEAPIDGKEREVYIKARVNQGIFKDRLLKRYSKCCICGVHDQSLLVASHIKPWSKSEANEKLDVNNGLLLCPNHDTLFDKGYISFNDDGNIIISNQLDNNDRFFMNVNENMKLSSTEGLTKYLKYHRNNIFKK